MMESADTAAVAGFLAAAVRVATPLLLAALGETVTERAGVINLGVEGALLAGALAAALGSVAGGPWPGLALASVTGSVVAALLGAVVVFARANQIIAGTAVTLAAVGLTGAVHRAWTASGSAAPVVPTLAPAPIPLLSELPLVGSALFAQPAPTYLGLALAPTL